MSDVIYFDGLQIYERNEMFRQQVGNLQLIVGVYNNVQATILPVEKPLITQKLEAVDSALKKGLQVCAMYHEFEMMGIVATMLEALLLLLRPCCMQVGPASAVMCMHSTRFD